MKRIITIFPDFEPVLLNKDVGAILFHLAKECGWKASLAFFHKGSAGRSAVPDEQYTRFVTLIPLGALGSKLSNTVRIMRFLAARAREYDVVNFYHDSLLFMACSLVYKVFNRSGRVYFKLDMSHLELQLIMNNKKKVLPSLARAAKYVLSRMTVDLYSVETTRIHEALVNDRYYAGRLMYCPNGFSYEGDIDIDHVLGAKENIILAVGRLGSYPKYNELLIDAAMRIDKALLKEWKIYFVGPIDNEAFVRYKDAAIRKCPHLENTFVFTGDISDRPRLYDLYKRSKVLCLTSRWESFGFVQPEAMYFGNYIIASDLPSSWDLTKGGTIGSLFQIGDSRRLAELLTDTFSGRVDLALNGRKSHELIKNKFNWKAIVNMIDIKLMRLVEG